MLGLPGPSLSQRPQPLSSCAFYSTETNEILTQHPQLPYHFFYPKLWTSSCVKNAILFCRTTELLALDLRIAIQRILRKLASDSFHKLHFPGLEAGYSWFRQCSALSASEYSSWGSVFVAVCQLAGVL